MVATKSSTPTWGTPALEPQDNLKIPAFLKKDGSVSKPLPPLKPVDTTPVPGQSPEEAARAAKIAERVTNGREPVQTDIEDFTGAAVRASPNAGEGAPQQADGFSPAVAAAEPAPSEQASEEDTAAEIGGNAEIGQGGDGRPLSRDDNQPRTATVHDDAAGTVAGKQLFAFIERYERLEEEKKAIADDQKEVLAEAKGNGFDVPTIRRLIALRKLDPEVRMEREAILDLYKAAIGME